MIDRPKVLAIIPARGGSKGLPRKNVRDLRGRPLIQWTIDAALNASCIDKIEVSSDDEEILDVAGRNSGVSISKRPSNLASDSASSADVVHHVLEVNQECDYFILLQPTSPLRRADDIDAAFSFMKEKNAHSCVSVSLANENPFSLYTKQGDSVLHPVFSENPNFLRRQDLPEFFRPNGAIYINRTDDFLVHRKFVMKGTVGFQMPLARSLDIDTADDFKAVETFLSENAEVLANRHDWE